jgi:1-acyl-sn-glycerol-3-phosphate acyltransferase
MKIFSKYLLKLLGWRIDQGIANDINKCVIVMGPHTSNWDFIIGRLAFFSFGIKPKILIKNDLFYPPMGWLLKAMGGIPVDRKKKNNMTDKAVQLFENSDKMFMLFTPEGTRKYNPNWKKGFYYIAQKAGVPILICYMDYEKKTGGFHSVFEPTGNVEKDIQEIKSILSQFKGKFPEQGIYKS